MPKRKYTRAKRRDNPNFNFEIIRSDYVAKKRELKKAIARAQKAAWNELLEDINKDPWGKPYRAVMKKLQSSEYIAPLDYLSFEKIGHQVPISIA
ncbi:hypothetical protein P5V15_014131 [Pogonomyrmex californicus]